MSLLHDESILDSSLDTFLEINQTRNCKINMYFTSLTYIPLTNIKRASRVYSDLVHDRRFSKESDVFSLP